MDKGGKVNISQKEEKHGWIPFFSFSTLLSHHQKNDDTGESFSLSLVIFCQPTELFILMFCLKEKNKLLQDFFWVRIYDYWEFGFYLKLFFFCEHIQPFWVEFSSFWGSYQLLSFQHSRSEIDSLSHGFNWIIKFCVKTGNKGERSSVSTSCRINDSAEIIEKTFFPIKWTEDMRRGE